MLDRDGLTSRAEARRSRPFRRWSLALALGSALAAAAAGAQPSADAAATAALTPHQIVDRKTVDVLAAANAARSYFAEDPERFYAEVLGIFEGVIDFRGFARSVMGKHASSRRLKTLKPERRQELGNHLRRFTAVARDSLIRTYSRALLTVLNKKISVLPPGKPLAPGARKTQVIQQVVGEKGKPLIIKYAMRRPAAGSWLLVNLTVNNINLGVLYRNQFYSAMEKYDGDMAEVITHWTTTAPDSSS